jgi:hypothetical protein
MTAPNQMRIYHVTLTDGTTFHLAANFAEPLAPLLAQWPGDPAFRPTSWTTYDAKEACWQAAVLVARGRHKTVAQVEALDDDVLPNPHDPRHNTNKDDTP